jgi:hypothetical protein
MSADRRVDVRTLDRDPMVSISGLIPSLSCRWCCPNPPFAKLLGLNLNLPGITRTDKQLRLALRMMLIGSKPKARRIGDLLSGICRTGCWKSHGTSGELSNKALLVP